MDTDLFKQLEKINQRPDLYSKYTAESLWNDAYISKKMLKLHLNPDEALASRRLSFIEKSVEWMQNHFNINSDTRICDFGCGPGLYTSRFAAIGAQVTGVDFSKRSIDYAKEYAKTQGLNIDYFNQNYLEFNIEKQFNLITMIYCDFCVLSDVQRSALLEKFYALLSDDGLIVLDVYTNNHFETAEEKAVYSQSSSETFWSNFWSENPYYLFTNSFKYSNEMVLLDKYTVVQPRQTQEIYNWLKCYTLDALSNEFKQHGLEVAEVYANVCGASQGNHEAEMAVVARKASRKSV